MKNIIRLTLVLFLFNLPAFAETFDVAGEEVLVPNPTDYVTVTPELGGVHKLFTQIEKADKANDSLANYISEEDSELSVNGEAPKLAKYYGVKVSKRIRPVKISAANFSSLKKILKENNKEIVEKAKERIPSFVDNVNKSMSEEFNTEVLFDVTNVVPMDVHQETENNVAYSMFVNYKANVEGNESDSIMAITLSMVNIDGKLMSLYCYAKKDYLDWTRDACKDWTKEVLSVNRKQ